MGRVPEVATLNDAYTALAMTSSRQGSPSGSQNDQKHMPNRMQGLSPTCLPSFFPDHILANNLLNLGIFEQTRQAMSELGLDLDELIEQEEEPGLGNGGSGPSGILLP